MPLLGYKPLVGEQQSAALWNPARRPAVAPCGEQRALHRVSLFAVRLADIENINSNAASFFIFTHNVSS